jgi:O-Antigen ligase
LSLPLQAEGNLGNRNSALFLILAAEAAILCLPTKWLGSFGLLLVAVAAFFVIAVAVVTSRKHFLIFGWVATFPLGYYFFSVPKEHSVITMDRVFIALLLAAAIFTKGQHIWKVSRGLRRSAIGWSIFLLFAATTIPRSTTPLGTLRMWLDVFVLPGILAWYVLRYIDVRRCMSALHITASVMTIYVAGIGVAEVALQRDLLPLPEGGVVVAGDYDAAPDNLAAQILVRPNGPFATVNSLAMVGVVSLFFLLFLRKTLSDHMPAWQTMLHRVAIAAAVAQSLLPLYKSILFSFLIILVVDSFYERGWRRALRIALMGGAGLVVLALAVALPDVFTERADPITFYARLAQEKQTLVLFFSHPINGVGLNNFHDVAAKMPLTYYENGEVLDYPHNNLGAVLAETGITGFLPFLASQVLLLSAFWKLRRIKSNDSKLVWRTFLLIFVSFWINGMALTIVYFQDLNLWYMFVLAVLYKFATTYTGKSSELKRDRRNPEPHWGGLITA